MSSVLERFSATTRGLTKTVKPFDAWEGSSVKAYEFKYQLLTVGDLANVANRLRGISVEEAEYLRKIYVLAKAIVNINGESVISAEDLETYNQDHDLTGESALNIFELKVLFFKQLNESFVQRLAYLYDELQREYVKLHLGEALFNTVFNVDDQFEDLMDTAAQTMKDREAKDGDGADDAVPTSST